ncbi:sigma-70 family RNA polymerase sigma factor [Puteibacter caeruleilacunae]|nr:sigma-70 family RNA polymerase sigma factor [Puteibacter caeruleilacunae]
MSVNDELLIKEIRRGNLKVYESVFHSQYSYLVKVAQRIVYSKAEGEDIVQGMFIDLWENHEKFQINESLQGYLVNTVKNRCLNHLRSIQIKDKNELLFLDAILMADKDIWHEDVEMRESVRKALEQLPAQMLAIFKKKYLEDHSIYQIAELLKISESTVKVQLFRARTKLRNILARAAHSLFC